MVRPSLFFLSHHISFFCHRDRERGGGVERKRGIESGWGRGDKEGERAYMYIYF